MMSVDYNRTSRKYNVQSCEDFAEPCPKSYFGNKWDKRCELSTNQLKSGETFSGSAEDDPTQSIDTPTIICPACCHTPDEFQQLKSDFVKQLGHQHKLIRLLHKLHSGLHSIALENIVLNSEIEVLRKAFKSKCDAVDILKSASYKQPTVNAKLLDVFEKYTNAEKVIKRLQTEIEVSRGSLTAYQQVWNEKHRLLVDRIQKLTDNIDTLRLKSTKLAEENIYLITKGNEVKHGSRESSVDSAGEHYSSQVHSFNVSDFRIPLTSELLLTLLESNTQSLTQAANSPYTKTEGFFGSDNNAFLGRESPSTGSRLPSTESLASSSSSHQVDQGTQSNVSTFCHRSSLLANVDLSKPWLEACTCRPGSKSICVCAVRGMRVQHNLMRCKSQFDKMLGKNMELEVTVSAHRIALENQFTRNRDLSKQVGHLMMLLPHESTEGSVLHNNGMSTQGTRTTSTSSRVEHEQDAGDLLNKILTSFQGNLKTVTVNMQQIIYPALENCSRKSTSPESSVVLRNDRLEHNSRSRRRPSSLTSIPPSVSDSKTRRSWTPANRRQITLGSQRRISNLNASSSPAIRSMYDLSSKHSLSIGTDHENEETALPVISSSSPERYRWQHQKPKLAYAMGSAAKLLRKPVATDFKYDAGPITTEENDLTLLSQLYFKLNELSELLTKQQLINDVSNAGVFTPTCR